MIQQNKKEVINMADPFPQCKDCRSKGDHVICAICFENNGDIPSVNEVGL